MEFDLNGFINEYKDKDFHTVWLFLQNEVKRLDVLWISTKKYKEKNNISEYQLKEYRDFLGDFLFFMNSGAIPSGIKSEGLKVFLPIIKNFVAKKQLTEAALKGLE